MYLFLLHLMIELVNIERYLGLIIIEKTKNSTGIASEGIQQVMYLVRLIGSQTDNVEMQFQLFTL